MTEGDARQAAVARWMAIADDLNRGDDEVVTSFVPTTAADAAAQAAEFVRCMRALLARFAAGGT